jgi:hypothetical protein
MSLAALASIALGPYAHILEVIEHLAACGEQLADMPPVDKHEVDGAPSPEWCAHVAADPLEQVDHRGPFRLIGLVAYDLIGGFQLCKIDGKPSAAKRTAECAVTRRDAPNLQALITWSQGQI